MPKTNFTIAVAALAFLGAGFAASARAQDAGNASGASAQTTSNDKSRNVTIYFSARDSKGKIVTDLKIDEITLSVDGVPQEIKTFVVSVASAPLTIDLLLDVRGLRTEELPGLEQKYAYSFFTSLLRPGDLAFVREFSETSRLLAISSGDPIVLAKAVSRESPPHGRNALLQAVYDACTDDLASGRWRKAILLISDGNDNQSKVTTDAIETCLRKENVSVFAVGLFGPFSLEPLRRTPEILDPLDLLGDFARHSGGTVWPVADDKTFMDALAIAVDQIRGQYTIEFTGPAPKPNGKPRKLELKTSRKGITLFAPENMPDGEPIGP